MLFLVLLFLYMASSQEVNKYVYQNNTWFNDIYYVPFNIPVTNGSMNLELDNITYSIQLSNNYSNIFLLKLPFENYYLVCQNYCNGTFDYRNYAPFDEQDGFVYSPDKSFVDMNLTIYYTYVKNNPNPPSQYSETKSSLTGALIVFIAGLLLCGLGAAVLYIYKKRNKRNEYDYYQRL